MITKCCKYEESSLYLQRFFEEMAVDYKHIIGNETDYSRTI